MQTLDDLRRFTVAQNFPRPTSLKDALQRMGFVQADPIRAPARAQDLILRQRVKNYRAGDLERRYAELDVDEDVLINYGFVTSSLQALMHPRADPVRGVMASRPSKQRKHEQSLLEFVRERGEVHQRQVDEHFSQGSVTNFWGGSSNATTQLLEEMHYRGFLRVARREKGIRIYRASKGASPVDAGTDACAPSLTVLDPQERDLRLDTLVDTVVRIYAPLPAASLSYYVRRLRYAAPQWRQELTNALLRAKERLAHARVDGLDWYWLEESGAPAKNRVRRATLVVEDRVRLLAPFDPLVHDRSRFKLLWDWEYRFEAYIPAAKRKLGYYALPLLWREKVIGWANLAAKDGALNAAFGYVGTQPRDRAFKRELEAELERMRMFLSLKLRGPAINRTGTGGP